MRLCRASLAQRLGYSVSPDEIILSLFLAQFRRANAHDFTRWMIELLEYGDDPAELGYG